MSIQEVAPERLAQLFHHYHRALAPDFRCGQSASSEPWDQVPAEERSLLVAGHVWRCSNCQRPPGNRKIREDILQSPAMPNGAAERGSDFGEWEWHGIWRLMYMFADRPHREENNTAIAANGILDVGDFRIDSVHRSATLMGEDLALTPEEFEVLVFLTTHPQRFVTPRTMLATSWTGDGLHQTEFLKALLGLRKKIDAVSLGKQYLRAEPWVVYRFDPNSLAT